MTRGGCVGGSHIALVMVVLALGVITHTLADSKSLKRIKEGSNRVIFNKDCKDKLKRCPKLQAKGVCLKYKIFKNCRSSCACDNCQDLWEEAECLDYKNSGLCKEEDAKEIVRQYCRKTCNFCIKCEDKDKKCPKMVANGKWKCYKKKMLRKCTKSCTECGGSF